MSTAVVRRESGTTPSRRARRAERRRLKRLDALAARLAELHTIRDLLTDAAGQVEHGWIQGAWFAVEEGGRTRTVTAYDVGRAIDRPVSAVCLVGAVVQAAGGPSAVRSQVVQRTLDLTWHTLREDPGNPVRWCPGPRVRTMNVLELTYWNDAPGRQSHEVSGLLHAAAECADRQAALTRTEREALVTA